MTKKKREELATIMWALGFALLIATFIRAIGILSGDITSSFSRRLSPVIISSGSLLFLALFFLSKKYAQRRLIRREKECPWEKELEFHHQFLLRKLAGMRIPQCARMFLFSASLFATVWLM